MKLHSSFKEDCKWVKSNN